MALTWSKLFSSADDGSSLSGAQIGTIQSDIDSQTMQLANTQTVTGTKTFSGAASFTNGSVVALLGTATLDVQSTAQTTIYTVPAGKRCILDNIKIVCGAAASTTAILTIGKAGSATDFVGAQTMTNLAAQYDCVIIMPVPHASVPVKTKSYAAASAIHIDVTTADTDGATDCTVYVYGTLY